MIVGTLAQSLRASDDFHIKRKETTVTPSTGAVEPIYMKQAVISG
jgi:hypothetical protein